METMIEAVKTKGEKMKAFTGTFVKKNGDTRTMSFARLEDLPTAFLDTKLTGSGKQRVLEEGLELVWDLENDGFRVFNHNTVVGTISVAYVDTLTESWRDTLYEANKDAAQERYFKTGEGKRDKAYFEENKEIVWEQTKISS